MNRNSESLLPETPDDKAKKMADEKTKILQWMVQWVKYPRNNQNKGSIDASELTSLLQCLGFTLNSFEKIEDELPSEKEDSVKIEVICSKSKMKACLSRNIISCSCPSSEAASNAEIWNVVGCEPASADKINLSNSSILPAVSPSKNKVIGELLQKVVDIIHEPEPDPVSFNINNLSNSLVRRKSLESIDVPKCVQNISRNPAFNDTTGSPPKLTSSPIPDLYASLVSEGRGTKLQEIIKLIIKLGNEAYQEVSGTGGVKKRLSDIKISPLAEGGGKFVNMNTTHTREFSLLSKNSPRVTITPVTADRKKSLMPPPSKIGAAKKLGVSNVRTPTTSKNVSARVDTPRPRPQNFQNLKMKTTTVATPTGPNMPAGVSKIKIQSRYMITGIPKRK